MLGGSGISPDQAPSTDLPLSMADRSDVQYRADRFPCPPGVARLLERILQEEGVPSELAALPWIESHYEVGCYSSVGAAGPWQIMRDTGRHLDLRMDSEVDERYSWVASTRAAARYLSYLHGLFDNWALALAAYNCGEGAVMRASYRGASIETMDLPSETRSFVPRFACALRAYQQVDLRGDSLAVVWAPPGLDLRLLAANSDIDPESLLQLNRAYLLERTPSSGDGWEVIVPASSAALAYGSAWSIERDRYVVREGDTWESIASVLGIGAETLRTANPGSTLATGERLALPDPESVPVNVASGECAGYYYYTVRTGDTLSGIGSTVGVGSREVADWNGISRDAIIHPGQRLLLRGTPPAGAETAPAPSPAGTDAQGSTTTHTVVSGDTLWDLASRYGTTVEELEALNSLEGSGLSIGQVLVVRTSE
jgi:membrane-bound lytic murein transglycosylase D